jgi:AbrB family looped-hinge helix DNA binding protein
MAIATITSKGQVTSPKDIREELLLNTGDQVDFSITPQGDLLVKPMTRSVSDVFGRLHRPKQAPVSIEAMNQAIYKLQLLP